ncbi:DUF6279 family lipoprotein [Caenimonas aquaedulcis]|uniref:Lipoprotein n=1 Tax=Caenimonas aquaedulcis TaxID=2793270 RepID=A0A931H6U5_9BURK|nr:DUF6279 family lipoprotein [Caenimonas aquaedulcis]MBG9389666.1 hypothetical protein [Caenimonas aquaedulcis]
MNIFFRLRNIIGVLAAAALLAGCSTIKLGYNNLDEIAYWWLDGYVDFSDDQSVRVRQDLGRLHRWHRANELPQFASLLRTIEEAVPGDIAPAQACAYFGKVRERLDVLAIEAEPAVVTLASGLSAAQLQHLERQYAKGNAKFRKEWVELNASELAEKRLEQFTERSEMIYGKLDDAQLAVLRRQIQQSSFDPARMLAERQRRQRDALQTLRAVSATSSMTLAESRALMRGFLDRMREPAAAAERSYQQSMIEEGCRSFSALHNSMTPAQRNVAARRLRAWQRDLQELAAQR